MLIEIDDDLAARLRWKIDDMLLTYHENFDGSDEYRCPFCHGWKYVYTDSGVNHTPLKHNDDCLGEILLKKLYGG